MTGKFNNLILCVFLCSVCQLLTAQQYGYVQYSSQNGAPFNKVSSVIQDDAGFIWIGSQNGLYRFDGIHFDNYSLNVESQFVHQLSVSDENLLFVNDMSILRIENVLAKPSVKTLIEGSINEDDQLPFYPNDLVVGKNRIIWVSQSNHSIGKFEDGEFRSYRFSGTEKAQQLAIHEDSDGGIWALSPLDGLFLLDENSDTFKKKLDIRNGQSLLIHKEYLLVGSNDLSIYTLNSNEPRLLRTIPFNDGLITDIHVDHNQQYFVGSQNGKLFKLSDLNDSPQTIYGANEAHRVEELDFGRINEIFTTVNESSTNEQLWVSSETGLWLLQKRFFKTVKNLPMNNPIAISLGDQGKAWSPMNYLYEIAPDEAEFSARPLLNNQQANAVAQDPSGSLWVSTSTPKIELLKTVNDNIVKRYDFHDRGEAIFYLYPDSQGNVWFCQAPVNKPIVGLAKIDANGAVVYYDETKGFTSRVLAVKESSRGEIYAAGIGEESYLYRYDQDEDRFVNLSPVLPFNAMLNFEAHDLTIDNQGVVWLATTDGLLRYDSETITLVQNDILKQEEVRGVTHNSDNSIWISTATKGLVYHRENTSTALGELEGLPAIISAYRCITTDEQGRLWAGTAEGLVYSRMSAASLPLSNSPRLRKVIYNGEALSVDLDQVFRLKKNQQLQLDYNNLSFPANNVEYQYRLLAKEDREIMLEEQLWVSNGNSNILKLDNKELGNYVLELRARQPGGYQWSEPLELEYVVFLPWYMKSWFIYGAAGLLVLLISYYFRSYVRRRFQKLQRVLSISNEKLATKEAQLEQKIREYEVQREELANASSNIQTLELFTREIPKTASWDDIIAAMGKAVNQAEDINAFEIAFKEADEIVHRGYSNQERSGYTFRSKPFNMKTSLTCWAMSNKKEVMINDYIKEHGMYVQEKPAYRFASLIFVPFQLENDQDVVLCAYSVKENDFDNNDLVMFRVLAQFIRFSIHQELTKQL